MRYNTLIYALQILTNEQITQARLAEETGYTPQRVNKWAKRNSTIKPDVLNNIAVAFNLETSALMKYDIDNSVDIAVSNNESFDINEYIDTLAKEHVIKKTSYNPAIAFNSDTFIADYYTDVFGSCGNGSFVLSQEKTKIEIPKSAVACFNKTEKYSVINAYGDSMYPSIKDGDMLVVEHTEENTIKDNRVYVFCYDDKLFTKRLIRNIDEIVVISDNPDKEMYKTSFIRGADMNGVKIIGEIVGLMRKDV